MSPSAEATEIAIDSSIHTTLASHNGSSPTVVFISDQVGYAFFRDSAGSCAYSKTTDGGGAWGTSVTVDTQTDCLKIAVWYDRWTPGDTTGTYIHVTTMDAADLWYTRLDTTSDVLTTTVNASGANQGGGFAVGANIPSITKGTDGDLYMGAQDAGDSFVIKCLASADCAQATNWTEAGTNPFDLATDWLILMPLSGGNILAIRWDISADDVQSKVYADSSNSWDVSWTTVDINAVEDGTYDAHFGATIRGGNGDIYLAYATDVATFGTDDDIRTAVYSGGAWTSKTDVLTNDAKGITGVKIGFDENINEIYVIYTARTAAGTASTGNVYWKKSADSMTSWGAEQGPINITAGDLYGARVNVMSDERIYIVWDIASADDLMGNTIANLTPPDTTAPAAVSDLALSGASDSAITVSWTAPGDDSSAGTATSYDLRYSTSLITSGNFSSATAVTGEPTPLVAGTSQSMAVTGLSPNTTYFFAIKTSDEVPNTSAISNVPSLATTATPDTTAPAAVSNLAVSGTAATIATLTWTASGDDDNTGTATSYDVRYSTLAITEGNWAAATQVSGEPTPSVAGSSETMTVTGLSPSTTYFFAIKTSDEASNTSAISNSPSGTTSASSPPPAEPTFTIPASGAGGGVLPTSVRFSGQAYPGSIIEVLRKSSVDTSYENVPLAESSIDAAGVFKVSYKAFLQGEYFFAVRAQDKEGRKSGILSFYTNLASVNELVKDDLLLPPTIGSSKVAYSKGENLIVSGYAVAGKKVEVEIEGFAQTEVLSESDGRYSVSTTTANFDIKDYFVKARQLISETVVSGYSAPIAVRISSLQFPRADFNGDNKVDISDWSVFLFRWGSKEGALRIKIDMNSDGKIDVFDLSIFLKAMKI